MASSELVVNPRSSQSDDSEVIKFTDLILKICKLLFLVLEASHFFIDENARCDQVSRLLT